MTTARFGHTSTLLPDGKVLIAGGQTPGCCGFRSIFSSAELYDPSTESFTATGNMTTPRTGHTSTLLPNGKVLIAGGFFLANAPISSRKISLASAELYDPATGTFSATGNMATADSGPTAILLNDGKVLIVHENDFRQAAAELYDFVTGTFSRSGYPLVISSIGNQTVNLLPDGRVLLVTCCPRAQLYDPSSGTFSFTDGYKRIRLSGFGSAPLTNGTVLLTGGYLPSIPYSDNILATPGAELYDFSSRLFSSTGNMTTGRYYHTATPLGDGTVLIAGGESNSFPDPARTSAEIYDPASGTFSRTGDMISAHIEHKATLLLDGRVLLTGGYTGYPHNPPSAEVYTPPILMPIPVVGAVRFDRVVVPAGSSYSVDLSGSNLTPEMFFDVRFTGPESNESAVALNWQKGLAASHEVLAGIGSGSWTITGVRAHKIETDHTGNFFPISATIIVSP
jgi:hypothetical protein